MYTNTFDLPAPIVAAISNDDYDPGKADITASSLWTPPRQRVLKAQHRSEIVRDVSDSIYALIGKSVHNILEKAGSSEALAEIRLEMPVAGWVLGGKFDRFVLMAMALQDWKVTSVYSVMSPPKPEWIGQTNTYKELLHYHNIQVNRLQIIAILRDWSKREARRDPAYPQKQIVTIDIPMWPHEEAMQRITERVRLHQDAFKTLPLCSDEDRWLRPAKFAATKNGATKATKLFSTSAETEEWIASQKDASKFYVDKRPHEAVRCLDYCEAAPFCQQWAEDPTNQKVQFKKDTL
jgi:hypothetical protein